MKKITFIALAFVGCFLLASCNKSPKEAIMKATDALFTQAETDVKAITNAEDFLKFFNDFEQKKEDFLYDLVTKYDTDEEGNFTAMSAEENEALNTYMYDRSSAYNQIEAEKCGEVLEPIVARFETAVGNVWDRFNAAEEDITDDMIAEVENSMAALEPYAVLDNVPTALQDRFQEAYAKLAEMFDFEVEE